MPIASIALENFKNISKKTFNFNEKSNTVYGQNGSGKSSLLDSIAFAYCGTDRFGNKLPTYLINKDSDKLQVAITSTAGSKITRTLTQKGNSTIKITANGLDTTLNQSQLSEKIGAVDTVLSCCFSGYFNSLSPDKQMEVVNSLSTPIDPYQFVLEQSGVDVKDLYDLTLKSAESKVAQDRRQYEKNIDQWLGKLSVLESTKLPEKPFIDPAIYQRVEELSKLRYDWSKYEEDLRVYNGYLNAVKMHESQVASKEAQLVQWKNELELLKIDEVPQAYDYEADISKLKASLKSLPETPNLGKTVDSDSCPTCGQVVSKKMTATTRENNAALVAKYGKDFTEVTKFNQEINEKISNLSKLKVQQDNEIRAKQANSQKQRERYAVLKNNIDRHESPQPPKKVNEPAKPLKTFDQGEYSALSAHIKKYEQEKFHYEQVLKAIETQDVEMATIRSNIANTKGQIEKLQKIQDAIRLLPSKAMEKAVEVYSFPDCEVALNDKGHLAISKSGIPYTALSTGQKMKLDIGICVHLSKFAKVPLSMVFVDDADLMDNAGTPVVPGQSCYVAVDTTTSLVEVK